MGMSNSERIFSEEHLNSMEFNLLVRTTLDYSDAECDFADFQEDGDLELPQSKSERVKEQEQQEEIEEKEDKYKFLASSLEIKLPSIEKEFRNIHDQDHEEEEDDDDGFKTPTSLDHNTPEIFQCPPAPRKPKSLPARKRKWPPGRALLDLSNEIESLFPPFLVGGKIKKIRSGN